MVRGTLETVLLYGGGFILAYYVLKSWGIITTSVKQASSSNPSLNWKPLTQQEFNQLQYPDSIYRDDKFEVRTGRDRMKEFGFVG